MSSSASDGTLIAVLANPPLSDGSRTLKRVELAAGILGFSAFEVVNMFALASHRTGEISALGADESGWLTARESLDLRLAGGQAVLMAYGTTQPAGAAGLHFRAQVEWLQYQVTSRTLPAWHVGGGPRHPSRWQRWTYRAHPELPFREALRLGLAQIPTTGDGVDAS